MSRVQYHGDPSCTNPYKAIRYRNPRSEGMSTRQRLTAPMADAVGVQQLTPDQSWFRSMAEGRAAASVTMGAHAPLNRLTLHADGTMDVSPMEPDGDSYFDLGGQGGRDVAAGRP